MSTKFNATQIIYKAVLQQLLPYITTPELDQILSSVDQSVTPPLNVDATNTASLTVNVGPATVADSISQRQKTITFINNLIPIFTGGTVTFPSTNGGNITTSTGGSTPLTLPSNNYCKVLLTLDSTGNLGTVAGTPAVSSAAAVVPIPTPNTLPFAYVILFNNAGTIANVVQNQIFQFGSGGGGGGNGVAQEAALTSGTTSVTITLGTAQLTNTYIVVGSIVNTVDANPEFIPFTITNKTTTQFTVSWNTPLDSPNYKFDYTIPGATGGSYSVTLPQLQSLVPSGALLAFGGTSAPAGWLLCDGSSLLRATYPDLFASIGTAYGAADGTHFNLPDTRGYFLRGVDGGAGNDPETLTRTAANAGGNTGDSVGSSQGDTMQGHKHLANNPQAASNGGGPSFLFPGTVTNVAQQDFISDPSTDGVNGTPRIGPETRPKNLYVNYIIKT